MTTVKVMEYKAALAHAAGQVVEQRQNVLAIRNAGEVQYTVAKSMANASSVYTKEDLDTVSCSRSLSVHLLRHARGGIGKRVKLAEMEGEADHIGDETPSDGIYSLRGPYEHSDTDLTWSSRGRSCRRSSVQTWISTTDTNIEEDSQQNCGQSHFERIKFVKRCVGTYHIYEIPTDPVIKLSAARFEELAQYVALSKGVREAIRSANLAQRPALPSIVSSNRASNMTFPLPELFRSVCVCDPKVKGSPVYLRSKHFTLGPRGIRVARCEFLNLPPSMPPQRDEDSFSLQARPAQDGGMMFVLEWATNLFSLESGLRTWVLAAQMDVTEVVYGLTAGMIEEMHRRKTGSMAEKMDTELGDELAAFPQPPGSSSPIDWLAFLESRSIPAFPPSNYIDIPSYTVRPLHLLLQRIRLLHQQCFILSTSASKSFWQISWVSPALANTPDDVRVGFAHTNAETMGRLEDALGGEERRSGRWEVRWGADGRRESVWCVPMIRGEWSGWVCFLVGGEMSGVKASAD